MEPKKTLELCRRRPPVLGVFTSDNLYFSLIPLSQFLPSLYRYLTARISRLFYRSECEKNRRLKPCQSVSSAKIKRSHPAFASHVPQRKGVYPSTTPPEILRYPLRKSGGPASLKRSFTRSALSSIRSGRWNWCAVRSWLSLKVSGLTSKKQRKENENKSSKAGRGLTLRPAF